MKRIRISLIALAVVAALGGAFAFTNSPAKKATIYHAVYSGANFTWVSGVQSGYDCDNATGKICTAYFESQPANNTVPQSPANDPIVNDKLYVAP